MQLQDGPGNSAVDDRGMRALKIPERLASSEQKIMKSVTHETCHPYCKEWSCAFST